MIDITATLLRIVATLLIVVALWCWARVGSGWLAAGLMLILAGMAFEIDANRLGRLDRAVEGWFSAHRTGAWQTYAASVHHFLGQPVRFAVAVIVCAILLAWQARSEIRAVLVVAAVGVGLGVEEALKAVIGGRDFLPRYAHAFPSGHVTLWAAFFGMVAVCLGIGRSRATRAVLALLAMAGVASVAFVTLYSRAHIVTDTIGGALLGGAIVAFGAAILAVAEHRMQPPVVVDVVQLPAAMTAHTRPISMPFPMPASGPMRQPMPRRQPVPMRQPPRPGRPAHPMRPPMPVRPGYPTSRPPVAARQMWAPPTVPIRAQRPSPRPLREPPLYSGQHR